MRNGNGNGNGNGLKLNKSTDRIEMWFFTLIIIFLSFGGLGGSLQPSRILCLALLPYIIRNLTLAFIRVASNINIGAVTFIVSILFLSVLSSLWSFDFIKTLGYTLVLNINALPLIYVATLNSRRRRLALGAAVAGWFWALLITIPFAFYELSTGNHFLFALDERGTGDVNLLPYASVFFGNYNDYSVFIILCLSAVLVLKSKSLTKMDFSIATLVVLASAAICVVANTSRAAMISLFAMSLFVAFVRLSWLRFLSFSICFVVVVLLIVDVFDSPLIAYIGLKAVDFSTDLTEGIGRLAILSAGFEAMLNTAGLGVGAGAYGAYFQMMNYDIIPNPHNLFLEIALNFGMIGLVIFTLHLTYMVFCIFRAIKYKVADPVEGYAFVLILLLLPIIGVAQSHLTGYTYFWMWYAVSAP